MPPPPAVCSISMPAQYGAKDRTRALCILRKHSTKGAVSSPMLYTSYYSFESAAFKGFLSLVMRPSELCVTSPCRPPLPHLVFLLPHSPVSPQFPTIGHLQSHFLGCETNTLSFEPYLLGHHYQRFRSPFPSFGPSLRSVGVCHCTFRNPSGYPIA